jgi:plasmid stability protein
MACILHALRWLGMANVQIRNVSSETHRRLKAEAARRGMSLSELLRAELDAIAAQPTPDEMRETLRRLRRLPRLDLGQTPAEIIRAMRDAT